MAVETGESLVYNAYRTLVSNENEFSSPGLAHLRYSIASELAVLHVVIAEPMRLWVVAIQPSARHGEPQQPLAIYQDIVYTIAAYRIRIAVGMFELFQLAGREVVSEHALSRDGYPQVSLSLVLQVWFR